MGLDTVEFIIELEKEFDIVISDSEAEKTGTVGEVAYLIAKLLSEKPGTSVTYETPLPKVIDILVNSYGVPRQKINTSSHVIYDLGLD